MAKNGLNDLGKNLKPKEFLLLKSKDDLTLEHNKNTPLFKLTGFLGTAGEAIQDSTGKITLFVDPRYHIQAEAQTKGRNVEVVKLDMKTSLTDALKSLLRKGSTLYVPSKSTKISTYKTFKKELKGIEILP